MPAGVRRSALGARSEGDRIHRTRNLLDQTVVVQRRVERDVARKRCGQCFGDQKWVERIRQRPAPSSQSQNVAGGRKAS